MAWLTGYGYRQKVPLKRVDGAVTDYQMLLTVNKGAGDSSGAVIYLKNHALSWEGTVPNDLRFTRADEVTELPYWIEFSDANTAKVWGKYNSIETTDTYFCVYYGKSADSSVSNAPNTFLLGEVFPDTTNWTVLAGTWSLVGDDYKGVHDGTAGNRKSSRSAYSPPANFRLLSRIKSSVDNSLANIVFRAATNANDDNNRIWVRLDQRAVNTSAHDGGFHCAEDVSGTEYWRGYYDFAPVVNQYYHVQLTASGSTVKGYLDGTLRWTATVTQTASGYLLVQVEYLSGHDAFFDYICIGQYVDPEPTWGTWGTEECFPHSTGFTIG